MTVQGAIAELRAEVKIDAMLEGGGVTSVRLTGEGVGGEVEGKWRVVAGGRAGARRVTTSELCRRLPTLDI